MKQVCVNAVHLLVHAGDDAGRGVADRRDSDAAAEVDELVAVGVDQDPAAGVHHVHRQRRTDARGHRGRLAGVQLLRARPRDGRPEHPALLDTGDDGHLARPGVADGRLQGVGHGVSQGLRTVTVPR